MAGSGWQAAKVTRVEIPVRGRSSPEPFDVWETPNGMVFSEPGVDWEAPPAWMSPDPHMTTDLVDLVPEAPVAAAGKLKAFVPVILGCDFAWTYCIVPTTRGPERSRPVGDGA